MKVTYFGTTTLLFDDGQDQILFDAHLTRPSLMKYIFGSEGTDTALADQLLAAHPMDRLRAIFISHSHHDHVMDAPYIAKKTGAHVFGSISALNVCRGGGVPEAQLTGFTEETEFTVGDFRIRVIPSLHSKPTILNNDLGQTIDAPLKQPARLRDYKEGGSWDFYIEHQGRRFLIRPSFNYIEHQLDGIRADVLFLGTAGLAKADTATKEAFFRETIDKVRPELVIPVHWDNFFSRLDRPAKGMIPLVEKTEVAFYELMKYCEAKDIAFAVQIPRSFLRV